MNFKMKAVVAALALTASMSASAAMTNAASGDSSLILTLLDNANNISATFDLGQSYSSFQAATATSSMSWNLAGNADYSAAWNSFTSVANLANAHWAIYAADGNGSGVGQRGYIATYTTLPAVLQTNAVMTTQIGNFDNYIDKNNLLGNHVAVVDGADTTVGGFEFAGDAKAYNANGQIGNKGAVTWGSFGQSLGVVVFKSTAASNDILKKVSATTYGNAYGASTFAMTSNGALSYTVAAAPVPEADTWAMLLAGLGLMGFIARRRTAA